MPPPFLLAQNITKRREMIKMNNSTNAMPHILPDYVLPYTIFLLAHDPDLTHHRDVNALKNIQDCLWFMLEPLIKNESYSYNFFRCVFLGSFVYVYYVCVSVS